MSPKNLIVRLVTLAVLASMILAACAPAATPAPVEPTKAEAVEPTKAPEPTAEPTMEPPVELTYTYPGSIPTDVASVEAALSEITLAKFNATIKLNPVDWGAYTDKVNLMVAAGEGCDVLFVAPWMSPSYAQLVANGALAPLDELLAATPELVKSMPAGALDATKIDGKTYGIPNQQIWVKPFGPIVRTDLAEKYGFDVSKVTKLEDLEPTSQPSKPVKPKFSPPPMAFSAMNFLAGTRW